jgi:hypothetical protein
MAAFVVLLVAVWGVGFLWVHGDLSSSSERILASKAKSSQGADAGPSATPSPSPSTEPSEVPSEKAHTGKIARSEERKPVAINPAPSRPKPLVLPPVVEFTMATFNLLGSSHTGGHGKDPGRASGTQRLNGALALLAKHQVSVVGFQEFQPNQRQAFRSRAPGWAMYPGLSLDNRAGENSVAWRLDTWELVKPATVPIPYFNGRIRPMPYVLLRNKQTGIQAYFSTFHNPADVRQFHNQGRFRNVATAREITLFNQLQRSGVPQFVTGDMNDRGGYFCRITGATPLIAAAGGSNSGGCVVPRPTQIDWIFGSPGVQFSGYGIDRSALVRRTTDHPVVYTTVAIDSLKFKNSYDPTFAIAPASG